MLLEYQGFQVVLPANMRQEKPYIWLKKEGKYYVELGETEVGDLIRIDHFLENFEKHIDMLKEGLQKMLARKKAIEEELEKKEGYYEQISELRAKLEEIDKKLGVKVA